MEAQQLLSVWLVHRCVDVSHLLPLDYVPNCVCVFGRETKAENKLVQLHSKAGTSAGASGLAPRPFLGRRVLFDNLWNALCQCSHPEPGARIKALVNELRYPVRNERHFAFALAAGTLPSATCSLQKSVKFNFW